MYSDILGEWELVMGENGKGVSGGRILFLEKDGKIVVKDADPEAEDPPARVSVEGEKLRFELLSAGSSRGNVHHNYELRLADDGTLAGTRRRGLMMKYPLVGYRVNAVQQTPDLASAEAAARDAEAEAIAAFEAARQAAAKVAAARAAIQGFDAAQAGTAESPSVPPEVLAVLPAPTAPPQSPASPPQYPAPGGQ